MWTLLESFWCDYRRQIVLSSTLNFIMLRLRVEPVWSAMLASAARIQIRVKCPVRGEFTQTAPIGMFASGQVLWKFGPEPSHAPSRVLFTHRKRRTLKILRSLRRSPSWRMSLGCTPPVLQRQLIWFQVSLPSPALLVHFQWCFIDSWLELNHYLSRTSC